MNPCRYIISICTYINLQALQLCSCYDVMLIVCPLRVVQRISPLFYLLYNTQGPDFGKENAVPTHKREITENEALLYVKTKTSFFLRFRTLEHAPMRKRTGCLSPGNSLWIGLERIPPCSSDYHLKSSLPTSSSTTASRKMH